MKMFIASADADWRVYEVTYDHVPTPGYESRFPVLYRNDINEDDENWETTYTHTPHELERTPVALHVVAADELGAFAQAQAWLDERRINGG